MRKFSANDKCQKCKYYCKKFIAFLFSHIGLCGLVVAYVILGAISFSYLEADYERNVKLRVQELHNRTVEDLWNTTCANAPMADLYVQENPALNIRNDIADSRSWKNRILDQARREATLDLWNITLEMNVLFEKNWTALVNERILQYQNHLLDILLNDSMQLNNVTFFPGSYPSNDTTYDSEGRESLRTKLYSFEKQVLQEVRQHGYDGDDDASEAGTVQWSVAGGLLYSLTVITTIGYGHITPKTIAGKLGTMLYAIVGIPLMLLCLANIGDALAHAFKFFYWKICCLYCEIKKRRQRLMRIQSIRMSRKSQRSSNNTMLSNNIAGGSIHASFKARPPSSATLPSQDLKMGNTNTLIKISEGTPTPSPTTDVIDEKTIILLDSPDNSGITNEAATTSNEPSTDSGNQTSNNPYRYSNSNTLQANFSIGNDEKKGPPLATDDEDAETAIDDHDEEKKMMVLIHPADSKRKLSVCNMPPETIEGIDYADESPPPSPNQLSPDEHTAVIIHDVQDMDDRLGDFEPRYEKASVPVYVCLLVVFGYIMGGSILFATWEGWDLLNGAYFCFITLTTIGFGDFVPGVSSSGAFTHNSEEKLTLCSLYLVFGMALLAMSFNLVQEAATDKAKWVARKIGILAEDSDEDD